MKLYIAECYDRHIDPVIKVFDSLQAAVNYAKDFVHDNLGTRTALKKNRLIGRCTIVAILAKATMYGLRKEH